MTTYKTGNPLGSAAVKDLFDNAENLDHFENDRSNETWENRFGVPGKTRYGMEQEHDRQISSQEARFQQFLLSSGYVFLGDYQDGPFQFSARNQYIRYNNQYYRLNAATNVGFNTTGTTAASFANDVSHFVLIDGDTLRQELASGTGTDLIGFQKVKLTDELKKISGLKSLGYAPVFPMGFDSASYGMLYQFKGADVTHLFRGSIHAGKKLFGIRNNACVTSFRAGEGSEDQGMWNSQVTGVSNNLRLAQYGSTDKVGAYGDIAGTIQKAYQAPLPAVSFTDNGFYTANTDVLNNAKVGMIMYTDESPRKWNIIASIDKSTGLITGWDNWADSSAYGTPATGSNVTVDPEGKLWTLNYNLIFPSGGRANQGVIAELGLLNQNGNSSNVNGIDLVNLPQSTSDGDTALLIRGGGYSGSKGWLTGASIRGYKNYGLWFAYTPEYVAASDIRFATASNIGIQFTGGHATYSMTFALGGSGTFKDVLQTMLDPKGFTVRSGRLAAVITGTATLSANIKCYRLNISSAATITLPNTDGLSAGHCQELLMYRNTAITIQSFNGTTLVSIGAGGSYASQSWTPTAGKRYTLDWDGSAWKIWE
ncbi:hypothetical protein M4B34_06080 [Klebsiella pneumoniae]|uniref:hypothetical protein n=1 Tax=Klebsiella quasipneumoniae TaxID=1463165 RepID=UPI00125BAED1|nr:hypothetical protein [Klebsiella quasipneumoniae]MCM5716847.1 hypothetical protein [Klebsiella pneumoniae]HEO9424579.1 hypothetical protein [Klebsiella pneumoniae subsp. pneumoniae]MCP5661205.1 hypothetical protein [Klebsiella pneumoniae]VAP60480.1 Uncharacterised protein [Klebsiella quasipneumoniae]HEI9774266.1 hypothetical protein [Klebsiella pneumoniae]